MHGELQGLLIPWQFFCAQMHASLQDWDIPSGMMAVIIAGPDPMAKWLLQLRGWDEPTDTVIATMPTTTTRPSFFYLLYPRAKLSSSAPSLQLFLFPYP